MANAASRFKLTTMLAIASLNVVSSRLNALIISPSSVRMVLEILPLFDGFIDDQTTKVFGDCFRAWRDAPSTRGGQFSRDSQNSFSFQDEKSSWPLQEWLRLSSV